MNDSEGRQSASGAVCLILWVGGMMEVGSLGKSMMALLKTIRSQPWSTATWTFIALGIVIRVLVYLSNRSLWLDEASLSLNIVSRSIPELASTLSLNQAAPTLYLILTKLSVMAFGDSEPSLRLFPLIANTLTLLMIPAVAARCMRKEAVAFTVALFALNPVVIYYSSEVKQYSSDALVSLLLCWASFRLMDSPFTLKRGMVLVLTTLIGGLLSFSAIFVAAAVLIVQFVHSQRSKETGKSLCVALSGVAVLVAFCVHMNTTLSHISVPAHEAFLSDWRHQRAFMRVPPQTVADWLWLLWAVLAPFKGLLLRPEQLAYALTVIALLAGLVSTFRFDKTKLAMLLLPGAFAIAASGFEIYPWGGRFLLFFVPQAALILGAGISLIVANCWRRSHVIAIALAFVFVFPFRIYDRPFQREQLRTIVKYISTHRKPDEAIFVYFYAKNLFLYYQKKFGIQDGSFVIDYNRPSIASLQRRFPNRKVWVVLSLRNDYTKGGDIAAEFEQSGKVVDSVAEMGSKAFLLDLRSSP